MVQLPCYCTDGRRKHRNRCINHMRTVIPASLCQYHDLSIVHRWIFRGLSSILYSELTHPLYPITKNTDKKVSGKQHTEETNDCLYCLNTDGSCLWNSFTFPFIKNVVAFPIYTKSVKYCLVNNMSGIKETKFISNFKE